MRYGLLTLGVLSSMTMITTESCWEEPAPCEEYANSYENCWYSGDLEACSAMYTWYAACQESDEATPPEFTPPLDSDGDSEPDGLDCEQGAYYNSFTWSGESLEEEFFQDWECDTDDDESIVYDDELDGLVASAGYCDFSPHSDVANRTSYVTTIRGAILDVDDSELFAQNIWSGGGYYSGYRWLSVYPDQNLYLVGNHSTSAVQQYAEYEPSANGSEEIRLLSTYWSQSNLRTSCLEANEVRLGVVREFLWGEEGYENGLQALVLQFHGKMLLTSIQYSYSNE